MSTIAVFLVLGGSAVALQKISGKQIVDRSITASKIKRSTLTAREVRSAATSLKTRNLIVTQGKRTASRSKLSDPSIENAADLSGSGIVKLQVGDNATLLESGPFAIKAECETNRVSDVDSYGKPAIGIWVETDIDKTVVSGIFDSAGMPSTGTISVGDIHMDSLAKLNRGEKGFIQFPATNQSLATWGIGANEFMMVTPTGQTFRSQVFWGNGSFGADCFAGASAVVSDA